jgi:predicted nucleotidyltransferase
MLPDRLSDAKIRYILDNYLDTIRREFAPVQVWFWGSRVYGTPHDYSDVDMIVVSERFDSLPFYERRRLFRELTGIAEDPSAEVVDVLCYTPAEFEEKIGAPTIVREAIEKGTRVE